MPPTNDLPALHRQLSALLISLRRRLDRLLARAEAAQR
jgi:hypothetical protein